MPPRPLTPSLLAIVPLLLAACESARLPEQEGYGPQPALPAPARTVLPTLETAKAVGWPAGMTPRAAPGFAVNAFAAGLDHPRWLYVLPNGDVLVAESKAPEKPAGGVRGFIMKLVMKRVGSAGKSADRITLLRDADGDGRAEIRSIFLSNLHSPFGMALVGKTFYVANTDAVLHFPYQTGTLRISTEGQRLTSLPAGPINYHWTRSLVASRDGDRLYAGVGSNSNVGEKGLEQEHQRAAVLEIERETGATRVFASGLRNPVGLAFHPQTGDLWTAVNERDELGSDLVPDYMTIVHRGAFYGWPYSYFGQHLDSRVKPDPERVAAARVPDYALGAHTSSLGLSFYQGRLFPERYVGGAFIGQHGSWNRRPPSGYKVIFVPFAEGRPSGMPEDILTGFLGHRGEAYGRPAGVAVDRAGALLVADDAGNTIWRVTPVKP